MIVLELIVVHYGREKLFDLGNDGLWCDLRKLVERMPTMEISILHPSRSFHCSRPQSQTGQKQRRSDWIPMCTNVAWNNHVVHGIRGNAT